MIPRLDGQITTRLRWRNEESENLLLDASVALGWLLLLDAAERRQCRDLRVDQ